MKFTFRFLTFFTFLFIVCAQRGGSTFEFYEYSNGFLRPITNPLLSPLISSPPVTTSKYSNNIFLNRLDETINKNNADDPISPTDQQECDSYWAIKNDLNGAYGELMLPVLDERTQIKLRAVLSVGARLPSVRERKLSPHRV